ncbi:MAG: DUF2336 domain-containing protein [Rickettsiales bacterium]
MDVHKLIQDPSGVELGVLAEKVVVAFAAGSFNSRESEIASDIFRLLLKDAGRSVRLTLAEHLYDNDQAPHDVIFSLACDDVDISGRVLQHSPVLTDKDLLAIVESSKDVLKLCAIARRNSISNTVSGALLNSRQETVLKELFNNENALFDDATLMKVWDNIAASHTLLEALVQRGGLSLVVAEKVLSVASDELKKHLTQEYDFSSADAGSSLADAREWGLLGILPVSNIPTPDDSDRVEELVEHLYVNNRLTYSLIVRALCMGFLNLFETSLARMAGVPRVNARILLMGGDSGFRAIYKAAKMPECFVEAVEVLLSISHELTKYGHEKPKDFRKHLVEKIYVNGYNKSIDGMGYLLSIIDGKISSGYTSSSVH